MTKSQPPAKQPGYLFGCLGSYSTFPIKLLPQVVSPGIFLNIDSFLLKGNSGAAVKIIMFTPVLPNKGEQDKVMTQQCSGQGPADIFCTVK